VFLAGACSKRKGALEVPDITPDERAFDGDARQTARAGEHPLAPILIDAHPDGVAICESCHDPSSPLGLVTSARASCLRCHAGRGVSAHIMCEHEADCEVPGGPLGYRCVAQDVRGMPVGRPPGPVPGRCGRGDRPERVEIAPSLRRGLDLMDAMACSACHEIGKPGAGLPDEGQLAPLGLRGADLTAVAAHMRPGAVARALAAPAGLHARLEFGLAPDQLVALDRLLRQAGRPPAPAAAGDAGADGGGLPALPSAPPREQVQAGRALAARLLCDACHDGFDFAGAAAAPDDARRSWIGDVGARFDEAGLAAALQRPAAMPEYTLDDAQVAQLVAYLSVLKGETVEALAADKPLTTVERVAATALFHARGCAACHQATLDKPPLKLDPVAPPLARVAALIAPLPPERARELLRHSPGAAPRPPALRMSDGEADEVALALRALARRRAQPAPRKGKRERQADEPLRARSEAFAARTRALGCDRCHTGPGAPAAAPERDPARLSPPPLADIGVRVRIDWLRGYLGAAPPVLRPALDAQMPRYRLGAADLEVLLQGFAAEAGSDVREPVLKPAALPAADRALAETLLVGLRCAVCHADSGRPSAVAPALALAGARLRPGAALDLLLDPPAPERRPRMPAQLTPAALEALVRRLRATPAGAHVPAASAPDAPPPVDLAALAALAADPERAARLLRDLVLSLDETRDAALLRASANPEPPRNP